MAFTRIRTARKHIALDYVYQQCLRISFLTFSRLPCNLSQAYTYIYVNTQTYTRTHTHTSCVHPGATNCRPWASSGKPSPAVGPWRCWGVWLASTMGQHLHHPLRSRNTFCWKKSMVYRKIQNCFRKKAKGQKKIKNVTKKWNCSFAP